MSTLGFVEDNTPAPDIPLKPTTHQKLQVKSSSNGAGGDDDKTEKSGNNGNKSTKEGTINSFDGHSGVVSLSYDQVNDNADELVELRGEGRYFGVTDIGNAINSQQSLGPLCANCHKRGHIRAKCKTVVCHKCGMVGDHYETQCPTTMICSKCGQKGHIASNCTNKQKKKEYCRACDTFSHSDDKCPSIWRSYLTLPQKKKEDGQDKDQDEDEDVLETVLPVVYCYNCGDDMHYGDECPQTRSSRVPNQSGSAFSGSNLPRHLREIYFERLKSNRNSYNSYGSYGSGNYSGGYSGGYSSGGSGGSTGSRGGYSGGYSNIGNHFIGSIPAKPSTHTRFGASSRDFDRGSNNNNNNNNNNRNKANSSKKRPTGPRESGSGRPSGPREGNGRPTGPRASAPKSSGPKPSRSGVLPKNNNNSNNNKKRNAAKNGLVVHSPYNSPYNSGGKNNGGKNTQAPTRSGILSARKNGNNNNGKRGGSGPNY
ncbi:hypothetical protein CAAN3_05S00848 [[Candida] anglica]